MLPIVVVTELHNLNIFLTETFQDGVFFPQDFVVANLYSYNYYSYNYNYYSYKKEYFKTLYWWSTSPTGHNQKVLVVGSNILNLI